MAYTVAFNAGAILRYLNIQLKAAMAGALEQTAQNASNEWREAAYRARLLDLAKSSVNDLTKTR